MEAPEKITLNKPKIVGELFTLMNERKTEINDYSGDDFNLEELSELMWIFAGINRKPEEMATHQFPGNRVCSSGCSIYPVEIYIFLKTGVYKYISENHELTMIVEGDYRNIAWDNEPLTSKATANIYFIWNKEKFEKFNAKGYKDFIDSNEEDIVVASAECGMMSQSIHLYCAKKKLKTYARKVIKEENEIINILKLNDKNKVLLAQCVSH